MLGLFKHNRLIGMVNGFIIWSIYFVVAYSFLSIYCEKRTANVRFIGYLTINFESRITDTSFIDIDITILALGIITVVTLLLIMFAAIVSWRQWRLTSIGQADVDEEVQERRQFMILTAFLVYVLSFIAILWIGIPIFMLIPPCF